MPPWVTCLRGWPRLFHPFISVIQSVHAFILLELLYRTGSGTTFAVGTVATAAAAAAISLYFRAAITCPWFVVVAWA